MWRILPAVLFAVMSALPHAQQVGRKEFTLRGRVIEVFPASESIRVEHQAVEGLMGPMTMTFSVVPADSLTQVRAGDRIVATLWEGEWTLRNLRVDSDAAASDELPPISYVCPTPGEETVLEETPGKCPISGAALIPVRIVTAYSCLRVQLPPMEAPGVCPVDRSPLVPITAAMHFSCEADASVREMDPGTCPDGRPRVKRFERRAHGDHNPRHGGLYVAMSADQWHHLEATVVPPGIFRVYFYDEMTRPTGATSFLATVAPTDQNAQEIGDQIRLVDARSPDGSVLEARIPADGFPIRVKVRVQFKPGERGQIFDFTFPEWSKEP
jgi:Cu/Ag efflux protein CusF